MKTPYKVNPGMQGIQKIMGFLIGCRRALTYNKALQKYGMTRPPSFFIRHRRALTYSVSRNVPIFVFWHVFIVVLLIKLSF